jgi:hypothetical protein
MMARLLPLLIALCPSLPGLRPFCVQEASKAYEAAAAYFKESPDQAEKPEFLQLVRELV